MIELAKKIEFGRGDAFCGSVVSLKSTAVHFHENTIQIVAVLRGNVFAHVSFERFYLECGDFIVINAGDPHFLQDTHLSVPESISDETSVIEAAYTKNGQDGQDDSRDLPLVAIMHFDLARYADISPYLPHMIFTLESFDLARYKHQESQIRGLLADMLIGIDARGMPCDSAKNAAKQFLSLLVSEYTMQHYYNRIVDVPEEKREKFFRISGLMSEYYQNPDALSVIASREFYSKSYILHLFKEIGNSSFPDILSYMRVADAEKQLLSGDRGLADISASVGFSDVKYLIRDFRRWFGITPGKYRKILRPFVVRNDEFVKYHPSEYLADIEKYRQLDTESRALRYSVNPISRKNEYAKHKVSN